MINIHSEPTYVPPTDAKWVQSGNATSHIGNLGQKCFIEAFFEKESKKPLHLRSGYCLISCPCPRCNPCCF